MTDKERKSCIHTIELLRRLAYNVHGVVDVIDAENCDKIIKMLEADAQQWIPCERELPDVGRSVLISVGGMYTAEGCLREDGDWTQFRWDAIQRKDMVGAWKPLEEPWKGEEP